MANDSTTKQFDSVNGVWNITEVIEQRAARHPAALAVSLPDRVLTYRELITAVHIVALQLLANGVQARQTVGVSMGQTSLHLITLLAIARIGAVALPLHSALPLERRVLAARRFQYLGGGIRTKRYETRRLAFHCAQRRGPCEACAAAAGYAHESG